MATLQARLAQLPLHAIVAFAARCARRVEPLYRLPDRTPVALKHTRNVKAAIKIAERFASVSGPSYTRDAASAARAADAAHDAAASAAHASADAPAVSADKAAFKIAAAVARAAAHAARVVDEANSANADVVADRAAWQVADRAADAARAAEAARSAVDKGSLEIIYEPDLAALTRLNLGQFPELGDPIDPSESGPLGPLWPDGEPAWYREANDEVKAGSSAKTESGGDSELVLKIEVPEDATDEEILSLARDLALRADDLHRALGGRGLKVDTLEIFGRAPVPEGVPRG